MTALWLPALALALIGPLAAAAWLGLARGGGTRQLRWLLPLASLPALLLAVLPGGQVDLPWLLLGTRLEIDVLGRALLLLVGIAWSASGWYAADRPGRKPERFGVFWLLSLAGIVLAAVAGDLVSFYLGYALMTLSVYGLVIHEGSDEARFAGGVYLVMAILAEGALLAGVLLLAARYGFVPLEVLPLAQALDASVPGIAGWLLLLGFSVKIGVAGVHLWLPLAHPVAPVPASAVLSGVVVKAGVLGLVRLVPADALPSAAMPWLLGLGMFTAFYGVAVGLAQTRLKTVLAYSTVSQMGVLFVAAVLALYAVDRAALLPLLGLMVLHHGLNKAALFIAAGSGRVQGGWRIALVLLPSLALAGLPLSSGALAKGALKGSLGGGEVAAAFVLLLSLTSVATACLLWRALRLAGGRSREVERIHPGWPLLVLAGWLVPWAWAWRQGLLVPPGAQGFVDGLWPLGLAAALLWGAAWLLRRQPRLSVAGRVPEGDVLVPLMALGVGLRRRVAGAWPGLWRPHWRYPAPRLEAWMHSGERSLASVSAAGMCLLVLGLALWLAWA